LPDGGLDRPARPVIVLDGCACPMAGSTVRLDR
jgi:hypothetical protein